MRGKCIMLQGTASSVGKSLLAAALCRILKQDGYKVAPFKSQNMALNSYVTYEGLEMGRAQAVQAEACGIPPSVLMNPVLLKPTTDSKSQVIINGRVYGNMSAGEYYRFRHRLRDIIRDAYKKLEARYDVVVIEGAGSPAEINLKENDIVNMGMAEIADAPVILVGDIDRGGVFASILGTIILLEPEERERVKGVIINKFRGDVSLLEPGIKKLEEMIKIPVIGVVPYLQLNIDDEDSVTEEFVRPVNSGSAELKIEIVKLPHISNFTDFNIFRNFADVSLRYINPGELPENPDMLILPGSKNTIEDLLYLRRSGLEESIIKLHEKGTLIAGMCGGYQMLGTELADPHSVESDIRCAKGIGLLDIKTVFARDKVTEQVQARIINGGDGMLSELEGEILEGYEIHMGTTSCGSDSIPFITIIQRSGRKVDVPGGVRNREGNVFGTYIHGIFDNTSFTRKLLNNIRLKKGLEPVNEVPPSYREFKEREYDRLARVVRESIDMRAIYNLLQLPDRS